MSRIVFANDLKKSVASAGARRPLYARPKLWLGLILVNALLIAAAAMSWKMDNLWSILPPAKAYSVTSEPLRRPVQSVSGSILGLIRSEPAPEAPPAAVAAAPAPAPAKLEPLDPKAQRAAQYIAKTYSIAREAAEIIVREAFKAGKENSVDPLLMLAIIGVESRFNPISESGAGALGLTQTMPESHPEKIATIQREQGHILNIADNIKLGTKIVAEYMRKFDGNAVLALQQYNGSLQDKTRVYSKKVLELRAKFTHATGSAGI